MIGSLRGAVLDLDPSGEVLLEVGGVGYRVVVTPRTLSALRTGESGFLYTHHVQREDAQLLYGFVSKEERWCFESLLSAHRVGPALALAILGTYAPAELRRIVREADVASLCLVPGVGKQTAARLLIELKGRLDVPELDVVSVTGANGSGANASAVAQVREALAGLGYSPEEVREVLRELDTSSDASSLLRDALRLLGARRA